MNKISKAIFPVLFPVLLAAAPVFAEGEVYFSGEVSTHLEGIFSDDDFESPLNPSNYLGLGDLMNRQEAIFKLEGAGFDGNDGFRLWTSLNYYPVGSVFMGLAAVSQSALIEAPEMPLFVISELNSVLGDTLVTLDVMRLSYTWSPGDLSITLGRQSFLTGYGYGWNPMDLVSPLKDPSDPEADMRGTDGVSVSLDFGYIMSLKLYGLYNTGGTGLDAWDELKGGGELTFLLPAMEVKAAALWGNDSGGLTPRPNGAGAAFLVDVLGAGVYAEGAVRQYSRRGIPAETGTGENTSYTIETGTEWLISALGGMEYYFPSGTVLIIEYFYNGEGFDEDELRIYRDALDSFSAQGLIPVSFSTLYRPGFFARQYGLVNILHSFWDPFQTDLSLTCIGSPDSGAFSTAGSIVIYPTGSLSFSLGYAGIFSIDENENNEAGLSPFGHAVSLSASYSF